MRAEGRGQRKHPYYESKENLSDGSKWSCANTQTGSIMKSIIVGKGGFGVEALEKGTTTTMGLVIFRCSLLAMEHLY